MRKIIKYRIHINTQSVGHTKFHEIAPKHQLQASGQIGRTAGGQFLQLREHVTCPLDRARQDVGEKRQEQPHRPNVLFDIHFLVVHVNHVTDSHEGVKRYAHGQHPLDGGHSALNAAKRQQRENRLIDEVEILEEKQWKQHQYDAPHHNLAFLVVIVGRTHPSGKAVCDAGDRCQQQQIYWLHEGIESIAHRQQKPYPEPLWAEVVNQDHRREKEQKLKGSECHCVSIIAV